jgi:Ca2+-binding EF-hand superfamily protein
VKTFKQAKILAMCAATLAASMLTLPAHADEGGSTIFTKDYIRSLQSLKMMDMMDANKDHKVTKEEFMAYQGHLFEMMDRNKDGVIDQAEWEGKLGGIGGKGTN